MYNSHTYPATSQMSAFGTSHPLRAFSEICISRSATGPNAENSFSSSKARAIVSFRRAVAVLDAYLHPTTVLFFPCRGLLEPLPPPWCGFPLPVARIGERKNTKSDHRNDAGLRVLAIGHHRPPITRTSLHTHHFTFRLRNTIQTLVYQCTVVLKVHPNKSPLPLHITPTLPLQNDDEQSNFPKT
jgi:hypothetical protein